MRISSLHTRKASDWMQQRRGKRIGMVLGFNALIAEVFLESPGSFWSVESKLADFETLLIGTFIEVTALSRSSRSRLTLLPSRSIQR